MCVSVRVVSWKYVDTSNSRRNVSAAAASACSNCCCWRYRCSSSRCRILGSTPTSAAVVCNTNALFVGSRNADALFVASLFLPLTTKQYDIDRVGTRVGSYRLRRLTATLTAPSRRVHPRFHDHPDSQSYPALTVYGVCSGRVRVYEYHPEV